MAGRKQQRKASCGATTFAMAVALAGTVHASSPGQAGAKAPATSQRAIPAIHYSILRAGPGEGKHPTRNSLVKLRYTGRFADGAVFGTSVGSSPDGTTIFPQYMLIPGCQSVLMLMKPGDRWLVTIPPEQAYGLVGHSLANKTLVFDLELVDFIDQPPAPLPTIPELPKP